MPNRKGVLVLFALLLALAPAAIATINVAKVGPVWDDMPTGYSSAADAMAKIPARKDISNSSLLGPAMRGYSEKAADGGTWWVFESGNEFYPSVVRRRLVDSKQGIIVKTAILCDASKDACAKLRLIISAMDSPR